MKSLIYKASPKIWGGVFRERRNGIGLIGAVSSTVSGKGG